jgi:glycerol-3-phosphate acyltransferase PlsX
MDLQEQLDDAIARGLIQLMPSGPTVGMDEEATVVRKKRDASINMADGPGEGRPGHCRCTRPATPGAVMASAIFRLGRLKGIDRPAIGALFPTKDPEQQVLVLDVGANMDCKATYLQPVGLAGQHLQPRRAAGESAPRSGW